MTPHEDDLLSARFAARAPEPLPGDWDDVLDRAGATEQRRLRRRSLQLTRRRLVALAVAMMVVGLLVAPGLSLGSRLLALVTSPGTGPELWATTWSPDGRRIAFLRNHGDQTELSVVNADGSGRRLLARAEDPFPPTWSPDGTMIAVGSRRGGHDEFSVVNADGTGTLVLARATRSPFGAETPSWSPDGRKLVFRMGGARADVYVVNSDGSGLRRLTRSRAFDGDPSWSPDGRKIVFSTIRGSAASGRHERYVMNADGTGPRRFGPARSTAGAWSPDGRKIAFARDRWIYVGNADGSRLRRVTQIPRGDAVLGVVSWSPDSRYIAFAAGTAIVGAFSIDTYVVRADGRSRWKPAGEGWPIPVWSPDGRKLLEVVKRDEQLEIEVVNADGSGRRNLTRNPTLDSSPAWSPDGRRISFVSRRDGGYGIYVMNADGSGLRRLTRSSP